MKKQSKRWQLFLCCTFLLSISLYFFNSCKTDKALCESCNTNADLKVSVEFDNSLGNQTSITNVWNASTVIPNYSYAETRDKRFSIEKLKAAIKNDLHCQIAADKNVLGIVLYLNNKIQQNTTIGAKDLYGVGVYSYNDHVLYHQIFKKDKAGAFTEISQLHAKTDGLSITLMHKMMKQVMKPVGSSTSFLIINTENLDLIRSIKSYNELGKKLNSFLGIASRVSEEEFTWLEPDDLEALCGPPCSIKEFTACFAGDLMPHTCRGTLPVCPLYRAYDTVRKLNYWDLYRDSMAITVNPTILYTYRDSILERTTLGNRYIDDYYYLGITLRDSWNLTSALHLLRVMPDVYTILDRIQTLPAGEVVYRGVTTEKMINVINHFKTLTADRDALQKMEAIISDVNYYTDKPAAVFRNDLKL